MLIQIDGAYGEGGGQILRTSLALSLVTGAPFRIDHIRANRKKPGLRRQHLTAVKAAGDIGQAHMTGNALDSTTLTFTPTTIRADRYHFAVGTAGSCTLVLQTILPALLLADARTELTLEGGTHNPHAPTFDFLTGAFFPILHQMGATVTASLERPGFYPAGGGRCSVTVTPTRLSPIELMTRGDLERCQATAVVSKLPRSIAERELRVLRKTLGWPAENLRVQEVSQPLGPGNVLTVRVENTQITEVFTGFGQRGVRAEQVARQTACEVQEYLDAAVPVGRHLADQLLLPMALAGGGRFRTLSLSQHTLTNMAVIQQFLDVEIAANEVDDQVWELDISA